MSTNGQKLYTEFWTCPYNISAKTYQIYKLDCGVQGRQLLKTTISQLILLKATFKEILKFSILKMSYP